MNEQVIKSRNDKPRSGCGRPDFVNFYRWSLNGPPPCWISEPVQKVASVDTIHWYWPLCWVPKWNHDQSTKRPAIIQCCLLVQSNQSRGRYMIPFDSARGVPIPPFWSDEIPSKSFLLYFKIPFVLIYLLSKRNGRYEDKASWPRDFTKNFFRRWQTLSTFWELVLCRLL
jgi:hypothetical protein